MKASKSDSARRVARTLLHVGLATDGRSSAAFEYRCFPRYERPVCACEILGLHAQCLRFGFEFECVIDTHGPFVVQAPLGQRVCERWSGGERSGHHISILHDRFRSHHPIVESPALGFVSVHVAASVQELGSASVPNDAR